MSATPQQVTHMQQLARQASGQQFDTLADLQATLRCAKHEALMVGWPQLAGTINELELAVENEMDRRLDDLERVEIETDRPMFDHNGNVISYGVEA
jgi:phosphoglycerate-specific signal transduction histidine kinase